MRSLEWGDSPDSLTACAERARAIPPGPEAAVVGLNVARRGRSARRSGLPGEEPPRLENAQRCSCCFSCSRPADCMRWRQPGRSGAPRRMRSVGGLMASGAIATTATGARQTGLARKSGLRQAAAGQLLSTGFGAPPGQGCSGYVVARRCRTTRLLVTWSASTIATRKQFNELSSHKPLRSFQLVYDLPCQLASAISEVQHVI